MDRERYEGCAITEAEKSGSTTEDEEGKREEGDETEEEGDETEEEEEGKRIPEEGLKVANGDGSNTVTMEAHAEACTPIPLSSEPTSGSQCVFVQLHRPAEVEVCVSLTIAVCLAVNAYLTAFQQVIHY